MLEIEIGLTNRRIINHKKFKYENVKNIINFTT